MCRICWHVIIATPQSILYLTFVVLQDMASSSSSSLATPDVASVESTNSQKGEIVNVLMKESSM